MRIVTTLPLADPSTWTRLPVREAMRPGVIACAREATLPMIASIMITHGIHAVVVATREPDAPSVAGDLDVVGAAVCNAAVTAGDLAREPMTAISAAATLGQAVELMAVRYDTHLLVIHPRSGAPVGVLSTLDVAAVVGGYRPELARMLRPAPARPASSARTLRAARAADVMHPGIVTCPPDSPLPSVARTMAHHRVHCVAVAGLEESGHHFTWGLISDSDLVVALHRDAATVPASGIATTAPVAVREGESLERVAALMIERQVAHLAVVGPAGLPSGIVSTLDVAGVISAMSA